MESYELRVHIAAPSMVKDDIRWQQVVAGVARFQPVRRHRLSESIDVIQVDRNGRDDMPGRLEALLGQNSENLLSNGLDNILVSSVGDSQQVSVRKRAVESTSDGEHDSKKRTKRSRSTRTKKGFNPTSKNPTATYIRNQKTQENSSRPTTPPEPTVLIPFTRSSPLGRMSPDPVGTTDGMRHDMIHSDARVEETSFLDSSPETTQNLEVRPLVMARSFSTTFEEAVFGGNQQRLNERRLSPVIVEQTDGNSLASLHKSQFDTSNVQEGSQWSGGPRLPQVIESEPSFFTVSDGTTETASNPSQYLDSSSPLAQQSKLKPAQVIDLTEDSGSGPACPARRDIFGFASSPIQPLPPVGDQAQPDNHHDQIQLILNLPKRIRCRASNTVSNQNFVTAVPPFLQDLAEKFDLVNRFYPVKAPRIVRNLERGYWKMLIKIAGLGSVLRARRSPLTASQWSDRRFMLRQEGELDASISTPEGDAILRQMMYPVKDPSKPSLWTTTEFVDFWKYLKKVIERGRAGYDIFATITSCKQDKTGAILAEVRLYGWGETLSHSWLILLGVSKGLTESMPLQWFGPGKGALVRMSGQPKNCGTRRRWVEHKYGSEGYWGLEDS